MRKVHPLLLFLMCSTMSCHQKETADLILTGGTIYTVDEAFSTAEAVAVKDHRILETGETGKILLRYRAPDVRDLEGAFVYPGWIDAHCHFFGYGMNLNAVDLAGTLSVEEIIRLLKTHREKHPGTWITGRGWDQNDWEVKEFPGKAMLDAHFPDTPVLLRRVDGHAAWVNSRVLELAGITAASRVEGGTVMVRDGEPTGILIDNAIGLAGSLVPEPSR